MASIACTDYIAREPIVRIAVNPAEIRNKYKFLSIVTRSFSSLRNQFVSPCSIFYESVSTRLHSIKWWD